MRQMNTAAANKDASSREESIIPNPKREPAEPQA
jgi:hypothetical protein